jgi:hypothetical protein
VSLTTPARRPGRLPRAVSQDLPGTWHLARQARKGLLPEPGWSQSLLRWYGGLSEEVAS